MKNKNQNSNNSGRNVASNQLLQQFRENAAKLAPESSLFKSAMERTGIMFHDRLMRKRRFQKNWKATTASIQLVRCIAAVNDGNAVEYISIPSELVRAFQSFTGESITKCLADLVSLDMLAVKSSKNSPKIKQYKLTQLGYSSLHWGNMEFLNRLECEKELWHKRAKISSDGKVASEIRCPALSCIHDGLNNITFDMRIVEDASNQFCNVGIQEFNFSEILCKFATRRFDAIDKTLISLNHELSQIPEKGRALLNYKGMPYVATLKIRCAHASFFATYIHDRSGAPISPTTNSERKFCYLLQEEQRWNELFCSPDTDPVETIRVACGFTDYATTEKAIEHSLNGSKKFPEFLKWFKMEYPMLFEFWKATDVSETTNEIGHRFGRQFALDDEIYKLAKRLGVKIIPVVNGFGVFAKTDSIMLDKKLETLREHLSQFSEEVLSVPVVVNTARHSVVSGLEQATFPKKVDESPI